MILGYVRYLGVICTTYCKRIGKKPWSLNYINKVIRYSVFIENVFGTLVPAEIPKEINVRPLTALPGQYIVQCWRGIGDKLGEHLSKIPAKYEETPISDKLLTGNLSKNPGSRAASLPPGIKKKDSHLIDNSEKRISGAGAYPDGATAPAPIYYHLPFGREGLNSNSHNLVHANSSVSFARLIASPGYTSGGWRL